MANKESYLGEFEHIVLLSLIRLGDNAYGTSIRQVIEERIHRDVSIGALYATLERLEKKGLVNSRIGESTAERGGRAKRYFHVTAVGKRMLQDTRNSLEIMWEGLNLRSFLTVLDK